jgi:hypothetical protein
MDILEKKPTPQTTETEKSSQSSLLEGTIGLASSIIESSRYEQKPDTGAPKKAEDTKSKTNVRAIVGVTVPQFGERDITATFRLHKGYHVTPYAAVELSYAMDGRDPGVIGTAGLIAQNKTGYLFVGGGGGTYSDKGGESNFSPVVEAGGGLKIGDKISLEAKAQRIFTDHDGSNNGDTRATLGIGYKF